MKYRFTVNSSAGKQGFRNPDCEKFKPANPPPPSGILIPNPRRLFNLFYYEIIKVHSLSIFKTVDDWIVKKCNAGYKYRKLLAKVLWNLLPKCLGK